METTVTIEWVIDVRLVGAVLFGLLCFGLYYDRFVAALEGRGQDRGFMSFLVAIGCAVTILAFSLMTGAWGAAMLVASCFVASGLPMMVGSVYRYARARALEEEEERVEARGALNDE